MNQQINNHNSIGNTADLFCQDSGPFVTPPLLTQVQDDLAVQDELGRPWSIQESERLYRIHRWGKPYFSINGLGHVQVQVGDGQALDLFILVEALRQRGIQPPILIHFPDILADRIEKLQACFTRAIEQYQYPGCYQGVFPLKCNQQRHVVADVVRLGQAHGLGLEVGSKPELLIAIATLPTPNALLVCNGIKDRSYIETALLAQQLGHRVIVVLENIDEVPLVIAASQRLGILPTLGMRSKLSIKGSGHWGDSVGERAKFGLTVPEILLAIAQLQQANLLETLQLLHFHVGSQISAIRVIKDALREACQIYLELVRLGAPMQYLDVGGGLGIDYDGSKSNTAASTNYTIQNYANDVVAEVKEVCQAAQIPVPTLISESGRALASHQSVLISNVLSCSQSITELPAPVSTDDNLILRNLHTTYTSISATNYQETYHDALQFKQEASSLFNFGYLTLQERAQAERLYSACCAKVLAISRQQRDTPDELEQLEMAMAATYHINLSIFQSLPDTWAVGQLFPMMPIHRLTEEPTQRATLADLTCDSDGKLDHFIGDRTVKPLLALHPFSEEHPYYLGVFLCGAYQEILGSLHNLFGDTNAVHVQLTPTGYQVQHVVKADTVSEILKTVQYDPETLQENVRQQAEHALQQQRIQLSEVQQLLSHYEQSLSSSTYLQ